MSNLKIDSKSNEWNQVAISIVEEIIKLPSQRKKIFYPPLTPKNKKPKITTNEWNSMALKLSVPK